MENLAKRLARRATGDEANAIHAGKLKKSAEMTGKNKTNAEKDFSKSFSTLAGRVRAIVRGDNPDDVATELPKDLTVYVALRKAGRKLSETWSPSSSASDPLGRALTNALTELPEAAEPDTAEVVFAHRFETIKPAQYDQSFTNLHRGVYGIQLTSGATVIRYAPTRMVATNRSFKKIIERFQDAQQQKSSGRVRPVVVKRFDAECFLVPLNSERMPIRLFRGNQVVPQESVTQLNVDALARRMSNWMLNALHGDGRMTYKYWPSRGEESQANNMIRQWMASVAFVRIAEFFGDPDAREKALLNIRYNLIKFAARKDDLEFILHEKESKLGATALAALSIAELPKGNDLLQTERRMRNTVERLWNKDGSFTTFLIPRNENRNQNFYPGEALLYLARKFASDGDPNLLIRIMKSVEYYRTWHLENRNPAFVPWHVMAYEIVWQRTRDDALRDWIFEMSDWLIGLQAPDSQRWPDINGRFYDPKRSHFGRPHASATGVYLEGMIAAWRVARDAGDEARQEKYRVSIVRGLRSLMQLEFSDDIDMFYVAKKKKVQGGVRTTIYDNEIRVDNVQHGLMAILQILRDFDAEDYRTP